MRDALHHPVHERFDPPLTPIPHEEVKEFCGAALAEMESRKNNKPTTRKKAA